MNGAEFSISSDRKTANTVKRFQSMYGLTADGIYGPKTKTKIWSLL
ncbi:hypothetical protein GNK15_07340 [Bacillus amyloliquefaciens]|nr:peptidoglycan-binding protein [Bacillus velezensis]NIH00807.1 hypothetical protein [Bacillus amyloliquefaciens]